MLVKCVECQKEFEVKDLQQRNGGLYKGEKVKVYYFNCPECGKEYISHCKTKTVRKLVEKNLELKKAFRAAAMMDDTKRAEELDGKYQANMRLLLEEQKSLKALAGKAG